MRARLPRSIPFLYLFLLFTAFQCEKDPEVEYEYNFREQINLYPERKSYTIGDTIWLEYQNPNKTLLDQRTNQPIAADSVSLEFQLSYNSRYDAPISPAGGFCDFITAQGESIVGYTTHSGTGAFLELGCDANTSYNFKTGIIPKIKGVYSLDLSQFPAAVSACPNRRTGFPLSSIEYRFNVADGNKDVYLAIPPHKRGESIKGHTEGQIDKKLVFVFKIE